MLVPSTKFTDYVLRSVAPISFAEQVEHEMSSRPGRFSRKVWRTTYLAWHHFNVATQLLELDFALLCNLLMTT